jgi:triacylglycerol lipase
MRNLLWSTLAFAACQPGAIELGDPVSDSDETGVDDEPVVGPQDLPVLLVHGINGSAADYDVMVGRLIEAGWDPASLHAYTFDDPSWGCNVDNAASVNAWVDTILAETDAPRVNLVAHSMGVLSTRYYLKHLGGTDEVNTYLTLGGMHHGLDSSCSPDFPFKPCIWDEICSTGEYVADLNAAPATPGPVQWISIYGTGDTTVPNASSQLVGAEWIEIPEVEHSGATGLTEDAATFVEIERVLRYPVVSE